MLLAIIDTMCAIKVGTILISIHQLPIASVKDTADLLIELRKLTLPLLLSPGGGGGTPIHYLYGYGVGAAQRGRDFEAPDLERGIHFRDVF